MLVKDFVITKFGVHLALKCATFLVAIEGGRDEDVVLSEPRQVGVPDIPSQPGRTRATSVSKRAQKKRPLAQTINFTKNFLRSLSREPWQRASQG